MEDTALIRSVRIFHLKNNFRCQSKESIVKNREKVKNYLKAEKGNGAADTGSAGRSIVGMLCFLLTEPTALGVVVGGNSLQLIIIDRHIRPDGTGINAVTEERQGKLGQGE